MIEQADQRSARPKMELPDPPLDLVAEVKAWREPVALLTYSPEAADKNPMFLEKRVYQGSSGRVYPLPFIDRIATEPAMREWEAIHIENEYVRIMILPEIGGRIHVGLDKKTGYDFFYRQNVIKPALVGLAGPWASGGVEFNWPQHHRPATFMPVQTEIEHHDDGSVTVWCADHDPMLRMKGMHGVCLRPGRAVLELKVRLYNRTQYTQSFLWWANVAVHVHEKYQSFFPPDVRYVADHAKRAITTFPHSDEIYYGVDYPRRAASRVPPEEDPEMFLPDGSYAPDDLSWYANIPVPTSYMVTKTEGDFSGGYDHRADAGVVHVANHHIAPGKKQWTWGNHQFGYAWDRSLTDSDGPYIEIMAGVYTDNQPDFSWLAPWETKTFTQSWYPIRSIGVPQASNEDAALSLRCEERVISIGVYFTRNIGEVRVSLRSANSLIEEWHAVAEVEHTLAFAVAPGPGIDVDALAVDVTSVSGLLIHYSNSPLPPQERPTAAKEPLLPAEMETNEELYLTGLHLHQYRHATRLPELYWLEALRRDPRDSRANTAMGLWHMRRGEFQAAKEKFGAAISSLTRLNPNPSEGEPYYYAGLTERFLGEEKQAYDYLYKATWNAAWRAPAFLALAEIDCRRKEWPLALDHVRRSLSAESDNLVARNLLVTVLEESGDHAQAEATHRESLKLDPLDLGSRWREGRLPADGQERLDLVFDLLRSGQLGKAAQVLSYAGADEVSGSLPMELLTLAHIQGKMRDRQAAEETRERAANAPVTYCFPSRLEELCILEAAIASAPALASPHYLLGNFLYDRRRHDEAIKEWETAAALAPSFPTVWRNLGIGLFNIRGDRAAAQKAFDRALEADPSDARILYERDQLWKRIGRPPEERLTELQRHLPLVSRRDDLSVELATLLNQVGKPGEALQLLSSRQFQPWEGGEGLVLAQYTRACILLGQEQIAASNSHTALQVLNSAIFLPDNLSEAKHLLANSSDIFYWLGVGYDAIKDPTQAAYWWRRAAFSRGDFQQMAIKRVSEMTYWSASALLRLGEAAAAGELFREIYDYSVELEETKPGIDYFATSLTTMLLFEDDLVRRNLINALFLRAQALSGLHRDVEASHLLERVLEFDRNHTAAADFTRMRRDAIKARS